MSLIYMNLESKTVICTFISVFDKSCFHCQQRHFWKNYSDHRYYFHDDYSFKHVDSRFLKKNDGTPIEKHKLIFDVHELQSQNIWINFIGIPFHQSFIIVPCRFFHFLVKRWTEYPIRTPVKSPYWIRFRRVFHCFEWKGLSLCELFRNFLKEIPAKMKFGKCWPVTFFLYWMANIIRYVAFRNINGENLKLIIKSADFFKNCAINIRIAFTIDLKELLKVVDEPVLFLGDSFPEHGKNLDCLHKFKKKRTIWKNWNSSWYSYRKQLFTKLPKNYSYF